MTDHHTLIHYHIFKNAGTSVDLSLHRSFGGRWGTFEGPHAHAIQSSEKLSTFINKNRHLVAISSHLARPPLPHSNCLPIVFIRHPLLRAYSVYQFTRKNADLPFSDIAQTMDFKDYIERWVLRKESGSIVIRDYQVVHLSDASWRCDNILDANADGNDLDQACQLLSEWGVAGVVEHFELSIKVFQAKYGPMLPNLEFFHCWENATNCDDATIDDKVSRLRDMLGESLYDAFMDANQLDLALYNHARTTLGRAAQQLQINAG
ncbi:MAG: sulfotransferase family 2 domain-containing protein [Rhodanobacter sp.]